MQQILLSDVVSRCGIRLVSPLNIEQQSVCPGPMRKLSENEKKRQKVKIWNNNNEMKISWPEIDNHSGFLHLEEWDFPGQQYSTSS